MDLMLRKTCRAQLTKLINGANELLNSENPEVNEVPVLVARLKSINEKLSDINKRVLPTVDQDQMEVECQRSIEYEDEAVATIARLEQLHNTMSTSLDAEMEHRRKPVKGQDELRSKQNMSVRLPQLELKKFNGDLNTWGSFWEQYRTSIHENNNLDDCAKFNYLQSLLEGKAAATINGLTPSQACYKDAIEMLKTEYGNNERIVDNYIQQLMSLSPIKNKNDVPSLRRLYNVTSTITRSLLALGISADQYGMIVKSIILKTMPYSLRVEFNKQRKNEDVPDVTDEDASSVKSEKTNYENQISRLLNFLKLEVESMENAQGIPECSGAKETRMNEYKKHNPNGRRDKFKGKTYTTTGLLTSAKQGCLFCESKTHDTMSCDSSLTINQKKNILKQHFRCYRCTKANHNSRFCKTKDIKCSKCSGRHATSMCDPNFAKRANTEQKSETSAISEQSTNLLANGKLDNVYLQTACAYVQTNEGSTETLIRMVLDGGSQLTFLKECVSRQLGLPIIGTHKISILPFGSSKQAPARLCNRVRIQLRGQYSNEAITLNAIEVPEICLDTLSAPSVDHAALCEFQLADAIPDDHTLNSGISLLIGADNYWKIVTGEYKRLSNNLTAVNTKLGWTLHGQNESSSYSIHLNVVSVLHIQAVDENSDIKQFWDLETIGIKEDEESVPQNFTSDFIENKIVLKDNRYEVSLPWKNITIKLDNNYDGALARVKGLTSRLIKDSKLVEYDNAVREYLKNDCAEIAPELSTEHRTYFMPHRPVYREDKSTTKLRVVFDASAHAPGFPSLNELLEAGENLVPQLLRILLNFRIGSVGLIADIEKAFLQISLTKSDRDTHRFLWYEEPITSIAELPKLIEYRMKRVTFGVTSSPFLLAVTLKRHLSHQINEDEEICNLLSESFYVDDLVVAVSSSKMGQRVYNKSIQIMSSANMVLRKWHSNDVTLRKDCKNENENEVNVLGVRWYTISDELSVNLSPLLKEQERRCITKRCVLQIVSRIFDPLGFLGPFVIRAKILLQEMWKLKLEWDEVLPKALWNEWLSWCSEIAMLSSVSISRCVVNTFEKEIQLHMFADASMHAYGTVAYIRYKLQNSKFECNMLIAKNRVAPINKRGKSSLTLPKLELTAALCAARLQDYILKNIKLNIAKIYLWSDSKIALYWIRGNPTKWKPYVSNRVVEIQHLTKGEWRHCPSSDNPADLLTRGVRAKFLLESDAWRHGPEWLKHNHDHWPPDEYYEEYNECPEEVISCFSVGTLEVNPERRALFSIDEFSSYDKILRITAYVYRFINNVRSLNVKITEKNINCNRNEKIGNLLHKFHTKTNICN